jgi:hypothetical protein
LVIDKKVLTLKATDLFDLGSTVESKIMKKVLHYLQVSQKEAVEVI